MKLSLFFQLGFGLVSVVWILILSACLSEGSWNTDAFLKQLQAEHVPGASVIVKGDAIVVGVTYGIESNRSPEPRANADVRTVVKTLCDYPHFGPLVMEFTDGMYTTLDQHQISSVCDGIRSIDQPDYFYTFGTAIPDMR